MEFIEQKNDDIIVELGCGYSTLPTILSKNCRRYICLDLSKGACKYQASDNISTVIADMQYLPFKKGVMSKVIAISSIEHVPDDKKVFEEISRISNSETEIIVSVPHIYNGAIIEKIEHSKFLLDTLYRFEDIWSKVLGIHLDYFIEQTSVDSFMKYYSIQEIKEIIQINNLKMTKCYIYEKKLLQRIFGLIPKGWFVLKDFMLGWVIWKIEDKILANDVNGHGIIFKLKIDR